MKFKLEKVSGLVALSYLVLIPAAAYVAHKRIQALEADADLMWDELNMENKVQAERPTLRTLFQRPAFGMMNSKVGASV